MTMEHDDSLEGLGLTTRRIESLTDGIFAIAMTLLVLSIRLPGTSGETPEELIFGQAHVFFAYFLSFALLATFWIIHHQHYHLIQRTDRIHLWINIVILMFVVLMPFSASLAGDFPTDPLAKEFFDLNMLILGILFLMSWIYASRHRRLIGDDVSERTISKNIWRGMIIPSVSFLALILSIVVPDLSSWAYVLIPVLLVHPKFRRR